MIRFFILLLFFQVFPQSRDSMYSNKSTAQNQPLLSFGLISDVQYCNADFINSRHFKNSISKLDRALSDFNQLDLDFIINLGDLIDKDFDSYDTVFNVLEKSNNKIYHLLGNHDYSVKRRHKKKIMNLLTGDHSYYSFSQNNFRFIILNTCEISSYQESSRIANEAEKMVEELQLEHAPNAFEWNGGISDKQKDWFRTELDDARKTGEKVLVFSHHTVVPAGPHNMFGREPILSMIEGYDNIIAWFSGHNHDGGYGNFNRIHFVTMKGMVESPDRNAYAVVEIYHNKIWIKGRGREKSQILAY